MWIALLDNEFREIAVDGYERVYWEAGSGTSPTFGSFPVPVYVHFVAFCESATSWPPQTIIRLGIGGSSVCVDKGDTITTNLSDIPEAGGKSAYSWS